MDKVAVIGVDNEVGSAEIMVKLGNGIHDGVTFKLLHHPTGFCVG